MDLLTACRPSTFAANPLPGTRIASVTASPIANLTAAIPESALHVHPTVRLSRSTFCNVTVRYTHPGQDDLVTVTAFLPASSPAWNGRLLAVGGGGWAAGGAGSPGSLAQMLGFVGLGYAAATTDAGLAGGGDPMDASAWALRSEGTVDFSAMQRFGSESLGELGVLGKALVGSFYGSVETQEGHGREDRGGPRSLQYSYFVGCSQGGRQAMMLAQRYPGLFDGILAGAPAVNLPQFVGTTYWPRIVVSDVLDGVQPSDCELDELARRVVLACDGLDGVVDGLVSDVTACRGSFRAKDYVGTEFICGRTGRRMIITSGAAAMAEEVWMGPRHEDGRFLWYGPNVGSPLTDALARSGIDAWGGQWLRLFVAKNSTFDLSQLTRKEYAKMFQSGVVEYQSLTGTNDPDLFEFKGRGGKILSFHGMMDHIIPTRSTEHYYKTVASLVSDISSFYRYFEFPGLMHCYGGSGGQPTSALTHLVAWVENGTAPDSLPMTFRNSRSGEMNSRVVCPYPQKANWDGRGDSKVPTSFVCK